MALIALVLATSLPFQRLSSTNLPTSDPTTPTTTPSPRQLFLKDCAHCHGADASGDEGPDLHHLEWTDNQIAARIRHGKKGQMTAFAGKLNPDEINSLVAYVRSLK